jgi:hypothetical protein
MMERNETKEDGEREAPNKNRQLFLNDEHKYTKTTMFKSKLKEQCLIKQSHCPQGMTGNQNIQ